MTSAGSDAFTLWEGSAIPARLAGEERGRAGVPRDTGGAMPGQRPKAGVGLRVIPRTNRPDRPTICLPIWFGVNAPHEDCP